MVELAIPEDPAEFDRVLEELPNRPAVFMLWPRAGKPYLARTNVLRKRLKRLLGNFRGTSGRLDRIEYRFTGSRLEAQFLVLELAKKHLGAGYRNEIRLRLPPYVKLILSHQFPRTQLTTHIGKARAIYFGPFRNRSTAARFESEFLDLFQLRRCQDDLQPSPNHPGCIYGEMGRCLRPCQQAVGIEEYRGEAERVAEFLRTGGRSLAGSSESARERLSAEMDFEGAALMHQRYQRIEAVLGLRDEMARDVDRLNAIAIVPSPGLASAIAPDAVELGWLREGSWQGFSRLEFSPADGTSVSLDARLRELSLAVPSIRAAGVERMEQLAVVARWFYSSWCDGELLLVDDWAKIPYRKLVNAVSRIAAASRSEVSRTEASRTEAKAAQPPHRPSSHS